jgi:hypothetical protein
VKRQPSLLREAQAHLAAAGKLWKRIGSPAKGGGAPSEATRDFAAHAVLLEAYPHVEFFLSLNDGQAHDGKWLPRFEIEYVVHVDSLARLQKAAEATASPVGMAELRAQVGLWSILRELPISDASEKQFCHWPGLHGLDPVIPQAVVECIAASKAPVWSQWSAACEALAHASAWNPERLSEIVPRPSYPLPTSTQPWSPAWGALQAVRWHPSWRLRRPGFFKPEIMWFLESLHEQAELPFAWEFRDGVLPPLPFPPRPSRNQWPD